MMMNPTDAARTYHDEPIPPRKSPPVMTWDEFEQQTAFRRPSDWRDRPDGPDEIDLRVAEARACGVTISRRELLDAPAEPNR